MWLSPQCDYVGSWRGFCTGAPFCWLGLTENPRWLWWQLVSRMVSACQTDAEPQIALASSHPTRQPLAPVCECELCVIKHFEWSVILVHLSSSEKKRTINYNEHHAVSKKTLVGWSTSSVVAVVTQTKVTLGCFLWSFQLQYCKTVVSLTESKLGFRRKSARHLNLHHKTYFLIQSGNYFIFIFMTRWTVERRCPCSKGFHHECMLLYIFDWPRRMVLWVFYFFARPLRLFLPRYFVLVPPCWVPNEWTVVQTLSSSG